MQINSKIEKLKEDDLFGAMVVDNYLQEDNNQIPYEDMYAAPVYGITA